MRDGQGEGTTGETTIGEETTGKEAYVDPPGTTDPDSTDLAPLMRPAQLPPDLPTFVGRQAELAWASGRTGEAAGITRDG